MHINRSKYLFDSSTNIKLCHHLEQSVNRIAANSRQVCCLLMLSTYRFIRLLTNLLTKLFAELTPDSHPHQSLLSNDYWSIRDRLLIDNQSMHLMMTFVWICLLFSLPVSNPFFYFDSFSPVRLPTRHQVLTDSIEIDSPSTVTIKWQNNRINRTMNEPPTLSLVNTQTPGFDLINRSRNWISDW